MADNDASGYAKEAASDAVSMKKMPSSDGETQAIGLPVGFTLRQQLALDFRIVPILGMLYLIVFLDRSNIANARIEGLEKSLQMPSNGYNTAIWIFYLPFVLLMIPSNLFLSSSPRIRPNLFLGGATVLLGVVSMCQGLTHSYGGLLACRFFMGAFEAVLPAGASLLLASYYTRNELSSRFAWFYVFSESGPCFSGLLAYAIENLNGRGDMEGWRWIFVIEGVMTSVVGIAGLFLVPSFPDKASFLSQAKRTILLQKLDDDKRGSPNNCADSLADVRWSHVLRDYKIWLMTVLFFCCDMTAASIANFLPTILTQLGWTASRAQVMSIPVWIFGMVCEVVVAWIADRVGYRLAFNAGALCVALAGWSIQRAFPASAAIRYFGIYLMAGGGFPQFPLLGGGLASNLRGRSYLAVGMAIQAGLGNSANFVASNVFISTQAPRYHTGFNAGIAILSIGVIVSIGTIVVFTMHNKNLAQERLRGEVPEEDGAVHYKLNL